MKTQVTWTFGNFIVTAAAEIELKEPINPLTKAIIEKGFLQLLQRVPASNAEKALAGYEKRPAGFKRDSIAYSDEAALKLADAFGTMVEVEEGVQLPFVITNVVENEGSETGQSRKRATALVDALLPTEKSKSALVATLTALGMKDAETSDREAMIAFAHSKGLGAK